MKVLVLGATGMIGSTMHRILARNSNLEVFGTTRSSKLQQAINVCTQNWFFGIDLTNQDHLSRLFRKIQPDVVVNCAGLTKHLPNGNDPISALLMNALLPHRIADLCSLCNARLIHISTDCVFSGLKGNYCEESMPDAIDIYGKTKHLGEVAGSGIITLRTSTIGHENGTKYGLLEWFLKQTQCIGYRRAIFSGLSTVEFARIVRDTVLPNSSLEGLYHVGAEAINKDALLRMITKAYRIPIAITPDDQVIIDRSLNSMKFTLATGYCAPSWPAMIETMCQDKA